MTFPFTIPDGAYSLRTSALKAGHEGHDVWSLQKLFNSHGYHLTVNGVFDDETGDAVQLWQEGRSLTVDRVAGPVTQKSMVLVLAERFRDQHHLPTNGLKGQLEHEAGFLVGNHTSRYPDGSYDAGVAQCNTRYHKPEDAFTAAYAIETLARTVRDRFDAYTPTGAVRQRLVDRSLPVPDVRRRWGLAMGSWNRPAYANWLAGRPASESAPPSVAALASLEAYIGKVTKYIRTFPK